MEPIQRVSFEVTEQDVVAVHRRSFRHSPAIEAAYRKNWRNGIVAGLCVSVPCTAYSYVHQSDPHRALVNAGVTAGLWLVGWSWYAWRYLSRPAFNRKIDALVERSVRDGHIAWAPGTNEVVLYPDQIVMSEQDEQLARGWSMVARAVKEGDSVYVLFSDGRTLRVPDRAFRDAREADDFLRTVNELATGTERGATKRGA